MRKRIIIYWIVGLSLITINSVIDYHGYNLGDKNHKLPAITRIGIELSAVMEVAVSPLSGIFMPGKPRPTKNLDLFIAKMIRLPFSFLLYFYSVRIFLWRTFRNKMTKLVRQ